MVKNPRMPPGRLSVDEQDVVGLLPPLYRIHRAQGPHATRWNTMREFGPLKGARWDPHPEPKQHHPGIGIYYAAISAPTAFAEVFQQRRSIRRSADFSLTIWTPERRLRLLDLTGDWALRHGASTSLHAAPLSSCRNWAQAVHQQLGHQVDGLHVPSTMTGQPNVALFPRAADAFPSAPDFSRPLTHPALRPLILSISVALRWPIHD